MERNTKSVQWEILTSLSAIFDSGDVTWPSLFLEIVIVWSYATENFQVQFGWKQFFAMIFKLMENFNFLSLVIPEKLCFLLVTRVTQAARKETSESNRLLVQTCLD